ncbi:hypothetical protein BGZ80_001107 [Entomortierella chlamydospora]|uniref:Uncharacterized protein n=1 Tax=Entomortierella chlamydospora TaxID=101097 RepID=A0A9P6SY48_9FUNG|nr:hypothetical protein BGZ79_005071 [Entomortierella chlamydospora]KAG0010885.1 hypothetical protein BGZ80_001107 [Entomortierella chlamydospora]
MASCLTRAEYERRTYIKQIGEFTLSCDRIWYMGDESEICPEEETEGLTLLNETLTFFKKHMFMHSLRKTSPVRIQTKSGKVILFTVSNTYWDSWQAELDRRDQEEDEKEE